MTTENSYLDVADDFKAGVEDPVAEDQVVDVPVEQEVQSEEIQEPVVENQALEQDSDKEMNFKAIREQLAQLKEERDWLRSEFANKKNEYREPEAPRERYEDKIADDDFITGAQLKQSLQQKEAEYQKQLEQQELYLQELKVKSQHSDYDEVTAEYGLPLIEKEPDLAQGFLASKNKAAYLYKIGHMAMMADKGKSGNAPQQRPAEAARRMIENSRKPGTLSSDVGGASQISKAEYYATMSDEDFYSLVQKNMGEI